MKARELEGGGGLLVMGLDISTASSGVVVVQRAPGGPLRLIASTTIKRKLPPGTPGLVWMADSLRDLTKGYQLDRVAIEDLWINRDPKKGQAVAIDLARLQGMVEYLLFRRGIRLEFWQPAAWRKLALGQNAPKALVPMKVLQRYGFQAPDEHQADAFGVAAATMIRAQGGALTDAKPAKRKPVEQEEGLPL